MNGRLRRLQADYNSICTLFSAGGRIQVMKTIGTPPDKYQFQYLVSSLEKNLTTGEIGVRSSFDVEVSLTSAYPRLAPQCRMLNSVFHPNIAPHAICIGDHWSAGESLPDLIVRIAGMLAYQSYNVKSPLNGEAVKWLEKNMDRVPVDDFDFQQLLTVGEGDGGRSIIRDVSSVVCANCGARGDSHELQACVNDHVACGQCLAACSQCESHLCLKCEIHRCTACNAGVCFHCIHLCRGCRQLVCSQHGIVCHCCQTVSCGDCMMECSWCSRATCMQDLQKVEHENEKYYACTACCTS